MHTTHQRTHTNTTFARPGGAVCADAVRSLLITSLLLLLLAAHAGHAADPATADFRFEREPLPAALSQLANRAGLQVQVLDGVSGTVSGRFEQANPREVLDLLVKVHELIHWQDGDVLVVSPTDTQSWHEVPLKNLPAAYVRQRLQALRIVDARFAWDEVPAGVRIYGPAQYVERVRSHAENLDREAAGQTLVFRWTDDDGRAHASDTPPRNFQGQLMVHRFPR